MPVLEARGVSKEFSRAGETVAALRGVDLAVEPGEFLAVTGESGSGKSTLLSLLAGLDRPTSGSVRYRGEALEASPAGLLARIRREHMGFVFQDFRLIRHLSAIENVRLPLLFSKGGGRGGAVDGDLPRRLLDRVHLGHRMRHRPDSLSRGEMQRVALARALVNRPEILFADEPTANLDRRNAGMIWELFQDLHREEGLTVVVATHDVECVPGNRRTIRLDDGSIASDESS